MEPRVRHLVAEHLGVGIEELVSDVSLRDDLAVDSLDLIELALAFEAEFAIVVPERILEDVHTFGDVVRAMRVLIPARCTDVREGERGQHTMPLPVRLVPPAV